MTILTAWPSQSASIAQLSLKAGAVPQLKTLRPWVGVAVVVVGGGGRAAAAGGGGDGGAGGACG